MSSLSYLLALCALLLAVSGVSGDAGIQSATIYSDAACSTGYDFAGNGLTNTQSGWTAVDKSKVSTFDQNTQPPVCVATPYTGVTSGEYQCLAATAGGQTAQTLIINEWYTASGCAGQNDAYYMFVSTTAAVGSCVQGNIQVAGSVSLKTAYAKFTCAGTGNSATTATLSIAAVLVMAIAALFQ